MTSSYPRFEGDYAGVFVAELARELVKRGMEIAVLAPGASGLRAFEVSGGVRVYRFSYFWPRKWELLAYGHGMPSNVKSNPFLSLLLPVFFVCQLRALRNVVRRERIQLVNAHWMVTQGLAAAGLRKAGRIRLVLTIHGAGLHALVRYPFGRVVAERVVRNADHIFCVSSALRDLLRTFLDRQLVAEALPMGIDLSRFDRSSSLSHKEHSGVERRHTVLFLGRLQEVKGARVLLEAASLLSLSGFPAFDLAIAGDGAERASLEALAVKRGLEKQVHFLGSVPHSMVPSLLAAADVVCVPSTMEENGTTEGFGMAVIEAMAMSKVVVASRVGGIPDVVQDGINGLLVEPGNPRALADKLACVLSFGNETGQIGTAARVTAEKFGWDVVADRYAEVFRRIVEA